MQQQTETALEENKKYCTVGGILSSGILSGHRGGPTGVGLQNRQRMRECRHHG